MKIVKQSNGNVVITDNSGNITKRLNSSAYLQWMSDSTIQIHSGGIITLVVDDITATQVEPAAEIPFSGDAYALMNLLTTDFFFELAGSSTIDSDAQTFISTADYSLPLYTTAFNNLVSNFKSAGLWSKIPVIYPMRSDGINQTRAYQVKYNLKDPRDLDAAFRLSFSGGVSYTGTGIQFGGVNGFANTHFAPSLLNQNSIHMTIYSLTNTQVTVNDMGSIDNPITSGTVMLIRDAANTFSSRTNQSTANSVSNLTSLGLYGINRTASNVVNAWRNSTKIINQTTVSAAPNNFDIYIGARNDAGTATLFSNREYAFATIGEGLTDDEFGNLDIIIQQFLFETGVVTYRYN